jgi:hypothetical protein
MIEGLAKNKLPQKCFQHNNNLNLYCISDKKPLCVSCMYQNQNQGHKFHRIQPLMSCLGEVQRDCYEI